MDDLLKCIRLASDIATNTSQALWDNQIPLENLTISKKLSRELDDYKTPSQAACAALQLVQAGRQVRAKQRVKFLLTRGKTRVTAWGLEESFDSRRIDIHRYKELTIRAGRAILDSLTNVDDLQIRRDTLTTTQDRMFFKLPKIDSYHF